MVKRNLILTLVVGLMTAVAALAGETHQLDGAHSSATFSVKHLVISTTKGTFDDITGSFTLDEDDIAKSSLQISIKTASLNTDDEKRDTHLKSADFFDVTKYPEIKFESSKIEKTEDGGYTLTGNLTIKDVTKEVSFPFEFNGFVDFMGTKRFGAEATLVINRQDFNVTWSKTLDNGGLVVGNDVKIELHVEGFRSLASTN